MEYSNWADRIHREYGIISLMKDLGNASAEEGRPLYMLGGGNPAHIPQVERFFRTQMNEVMQSDRFEKLVGNYAGPKGLNKFSSSLAALLRNTYNWDIGPENIAVTNGSQMAFTILFRLFSGRYADDSQKQILLPMTPEYIGYNEADEEAPRFRSVRPKVVETSRHTFKYKVDFSEIQMTDEIGAICVSRPTNPTGNMITDNELQQLASMAQRQNVPLIIDGAYGLPFPNLVFTDATVQWGPNIILSLSLSKLGLPGTRTGIVIAAEEVIELFTCGNAILTLASGNFGSVLALKSVESGEILKLSEEIIQPFYKDLKDYVTGVIHQQMQGIPYKLHDPEGAFFVWLWFPGLPISDEELYQRLKLRNVYVVPGRHFFPGLNEDWDHRYECIRISYAGDKDMVRKGIEIIAEEVGRAFAESSQYTAVSQG